MKWNRIMMRIGLATVVFFLLVVITPVVNIACRFMQLTPEVRSADAIVVLGSGLKPDGSLDAQSLERLAHGLRLYKMGLAPTLILSGPARWDTEPESTVRARFAVLMGVPDSAIFELRDVMTTRDEARDTAALLSARSAKNVLLVTESLHMRRAKMIFEAFGLNVAPAPSNNSATLASSPADRLFLLEDLLTQSAGLVYYWAAGFI